MKKKEVVEIMSQYFKYCNELAIIDNVLNKDYRCYDKEGNIKPDVDRSSQLFINETNARRTYVVRKNSLINEFSKWIEEEV